jgi:DNA repair exonuclease SbcCD nuclease subunit
MIFALAGDLHVNVPKRSAEAQRIARWMLGDWEARGVALIGLAGDIADGPMTDSEFLWLTEFVQDCGNVAPTFIIYGNHDPKFSLHPLGAREDGSPFLNTRHPVIVEPGAGVHVIETKSGPVAVAGVSFPWRTQILAQAGIKSSDQADLVAQDLLRQIFLGLGVKVRELNLPTVALIHGAIRGSKINEEQPPRALGLEMPLEDVAQIGADLVVCGHIHLFQAFSFNDRPIIVPGSPIYCDYGESAYQKGYVLAEIETE